MAINSRSAFSSRLGGPTTTIRSTSSRARNNSSTRASVVRPFRRTSALLPRPSREPDPAAATMAPTFSGLGTFGLGPRVSAAAVHPRRLREYHPAGRSLDHRRDDCRDGLVHHALAVLDDDHRAVVEAADTLPGLFALTGHGDDYLLARNCHWAHRLGKLVEIQDNHAFEPRDPVQVEIVGHDSPPPLLCGAHEVGVDLDAGGRIVVNHLEVYRRILLHLGQHVEPAPAATPPGRVGRVGDLLE